MFNSLLKATIGLVVETPVAIIADVITMGGAINDQDEPYTATSIKKVFKNIQQSTNDETANAF